MADRLLVEAARMRPPLPAPGTPFFESDLLRSAKRGGKLCNRVHVAVEVEVPFPVCLGDLAQARIDKRLQRSCALERDLEFRQVAERESFAVPELDADRHAE